MPPRSVTRFAVTLCLLAAPWSLAQDNPDDWVWNDPKELSIPGVRHGTIESESMQRTVGFNVYLPPAYESEPERRFPVVYFLHGAGGTESSDAGFAHRVHAEIVTGRIQPMVWVFPNGGRRSGYRDREQGNVKSETLIIRELLPHIDREYRTIARAESRGVCGFSMGGGGALRLMLKYPDLFGTAASFAAAMARDAESSDGDNVYRHAEKLDEATRERVRLYVAVGDEDRLHERHVPFLAHMKKLGVRTTSVVHSHVGHNLGELSRLSGIEMIRHMARELSDGRR